jgi:glutathione S-transferase
LGAPPGPSPLKQAAGGELSKKAKRFQAALALSMIASCGAIVLHVGRNGEALVPADPAARARATAWLIAALNSVEPFVMQLATIDIFCAGEELAKLRRPAVVEMIGKRLARLSDALGDKPYLDGDAFTAGDLMMTPVLRSLEGKHLLERHPNLVAYKARCQARPAFEAALAAQLADFEQRESVSA